MSMEGPSSKPEWWNVNQEIREQYSLPDYDPPRFSDNTYTYEIISELENKHDCTIRFIGINTRYGEDWEVRINNESLIEVSRNLDRNGNMIYNIESDKFKSICEHYFNNI